ncbi:MAG: hypothetical protein HZB47_11815 [Nitrosomonadales bacterium]|nr:hypothetical protein [Nitrosomonadales bacterium]
MPTTIEVLEKSVQNLPPTELAKFRDWFVEFDASRWDVQIEADAAAGKLDALADAAQSEYRSGKAREL